MIHRLRQGGNQLRYVHSILAAAAALTALFSLPV
jgi:hypothetical protein